MDYAQDYLAETAMLQDISDRYSNLQEYDIHGAFNLMKDAIQAYNRWSAIKTDIKKDLKRGEKPEVKERLKEICDYLKEVHTDTRVIYGNSRDDLRCNKESF